MTPRREIFSRPTSTPSLAHCYGRARASHRARAFAPALARAMSAADARARAARESSPDAPAPPSDHDSALNVAARAADWRRVEALLNRDGAAHAPDAWTTAACARRGNLAMLTMLVETHGAPWDEKTATEAIEGEHWDCARYAARAGRAGTRRRRPDDGGVRAEGGVGSVTVDARSRREVGRVDVLERVR